MQRVPRGYSPVPSPLSSPSFTRIFEAIYTMAIAQKLLGILNPVAEKEGDGRDVWPNRVAFILAAIVSKTIPLLPW